MRDAGASTPVFSPATFHQVAWWVCHLRIRLAGDIEENPGPEVLDPCSVCGEKGSREGGFRSGARSASNGVTRDAQASRVSQSSVGWAPWSCPSCNDPVPPSTPSRSPESSDMEHTRSLVSSSSGTFFSVTSGSWRSGLSGTTQSPQGQDKR